MWWLTLGMAVVAAALSWVALGVLDRSTTTRPCHGGRSSSASPRPRCSSSCCALRRVRSPISLSEIPLVVGLAFTPAGGLLFARVAGAGAVVAFHRSQRGVKLAFNLVHFALEASVALVVYRLVLGDGEPGDPRGWVAAFSATLLLDVIGAFTISAAISLHGGGWDWTELRESVFEGAGAAVGNTSLALVAVLVLERDVRAAWLLFVVAAHPPCRIPRLHGAGPRPRPPRAPVRLHERGRSLGPRRHGAGDDPRPRPQRSRRRRTAGLVVVDDDQRPATWS